MFVLSCDRTDCVAFVARGLIAADGGGDRGVAGGRIGTAAALVYLRPDLSGLPQTTFQCTV
jgi:hypothetical protein